MVECIEGQYEIRLEEEYIPHLRISPYYARLLQEAKQKDKTTTNTREFIKKKIESANWVIEAIKQRQHTLYRVVEQLVKHQKDFLQHGLSHLKPLKMQDVADTLQVHVSTVSRAIADKYIQTPRRYFPDQVLFYRAVSIRKTEETSRAFP